MRMSIKNCTAPSASLLQTAVVCTALLVAVTNNAQSLEEVVVVGTTPVSGVGLDVNKIPFAVQQADAESLQLAQSTDLSDFMNARFNSVTINSAQNNPLQPDLQFRGFTASPLLGLAQGLAVYQGGARINEPLGDTVNWDLLPVSAINRITLVSGADPLFGLNALGGALALEMKNGFNYTGHEIEAYGGSWERIGATLQSGGNNGVWGYYLNISYFDEQGWRDLSDSDATNVYASVSWRNGERSALNLSVQQGESDLTGNGALPVGLAAVDRDAIFTAPDITENDMQMVVLDGSHFITDQLQLAGTAFYRDNRSDAFNGDASEFEICTFAGGAQALLEEPDDIEDALEQQLGIELDDICEGGDPAITNFDELDEFIEDSATLAGLDPEAFELEDVSDDLSGSGVLSDGAINNISDREQISQGIDLQLTFLRDLFSRSNQWVVGVSYFNGESEFNSITELAELNPVTRSTRGLGVGTFVDENAVSVDTETRSWSVYFSDTLELTNTLTLTLSGRYNDTDVILRDQSGERPELNGDHNFSRFNPSIGLTWSRNDAMNFFTSYSESSRAPTPIELACNEGVFEVAQRFAIEAGEDPDDIEFECRLPNAFLADPPLDQVVAKSVEFGMRGRWDTQHWGAINYHMGLFNTDNKDDILFQTTGRATGLFANVDKTRRRGIEVAIDGQRGNLQWSAGYSFVNATFEDDFRVLSPNHRFADEQGEIEVSRGDRMPGIPKQQLKLLGDYQFLFGVSVGAEFLYNSSQVLRGDESNQMAEIGGYTLVNLRAAYRHSERVELFARVTNVFDKEYENFGLLGEDPDEVVEDLADDRPVFVGVGAPRGVWVGVRMSL